MMKLQIELPDDRVSDLEKMMRKCGLSSRKELFNNALTLFEWAISEVESGHSIASIDKSKRIFKDLSMPCLLAIDQKRQATP